MSYPWRCLPKISVFLFSLLLVTGVQKDATAAQLSLTWADNANNEDGFKIERRTGTTGTFTQTAMVGMNAVSYLDSNAATGTTYCYRVRAYNAAGDSAYSNESCGTVTSDTQAPTVSISAPTNGATVSGSSVTVSASASDTVGVVGVQFLLDGANLGSEETTAPYSAVWNTTTTSNGAHNLTAIAWDAAGNQTTSASISVTVSNQAPPPPPPQPNPTGLVAAYNFDEGTGTSVADASGSGNPGTISGATWTTSGKFGKALSFDGVNDWVTISHTASLHLTTGMTLEAWVYPNAALNGWRSIVIKEMAPEAAYELYANTDTNKPGGYVYVNGGYGGAFGTGQLLLNTWTHLATTYDGATLKLYVNGVQVGSKSQTGTIATSTGPLRIAGSSMWGEYFQGRIDNVRIYNRALSASEIQANMALPAETTPPPTPQTFALTVTKSGNGSGTISSAPTGVNCGSDCSETYASGTVVTLTAAPAAGSTFTGWSGVCVGTGPCTVTLTADAAVSATFTSQLNVKIGIFRPSTGRWYFDLNGSGTLDDCTTDACINPFGQQGNLPVVGDWTGVGTAQIGIFEPSTRQWKLDRNGNDQWDGCSGDVCFGPFVNSEDLPVVGKWKPGSTIDMLGIYRPSKRFWRFDLNGNGKFDSCTVDRCFGAGAFAKSAAELPVVGDWTGAGAEKIGTFNPSTGLWKLDLNSNGKLDTCTVDGCLGPFGVSGDRPVVGDWTGDGKAKIGVFDPMTGMWELDLNGNGMFDDCAVDACLGPFGQQGDLPVVGKW